MPQVSTFLLHMVRDGIMASTLLHDVCQSVWQGPSDVTAQAVEELSTGIYRVQVTAPRRVERVVKCATGPDEIRRMKEEYKYYSVDLASLQGTVIPRCYGFYEGYAAKRQPLACLVLEPVETGVMNEPIDLYEFQQVPYYF